MSLAFGVEMAEHDCQGFHALVQAHLVAEHRPFLAKRGL
jgi:hypothetical protein